MKKYKVHIPPVPAHLLIGELKNILHAGVASHPATEHIADESEADLILLDFRHLEQNLYTISRPERTIIVDYRDQPQLVFTEPAMLYFKRSLVIPGQDEIISLPRWYTPIAYCVRQDYLNLVADQSSERDIDIAVFFDPEEGEAKPRNIFRTSVARYVKKHFNQLYLFVGIAGKTGEAGRSEIQTAYVEVLKRARIIVTCNPDRWEGDSRLFDALAGGAAVLVDRMQTPKKNPFEDGKHLVYYDRENLSTLESALNDLLNNEHKRRRLAESGYRYLHQHHTPAARIQEILDEVESVF